MANLQFSIKSHLKPEKLMSFIIDFEYYKKFFPGQIKDIKILDRQNNAIITQENILFTSSELSENHPRAPDPSSFWAFGPNRLRR